MALGAGIALQSLSVSVAGAVVLVGGGVASLLGGIMYDAGSGADPADEVEQVRENDVHEGTYPGETIDDEAARRDAAETAHATRARLEAGPVTRPAVGPAAGWILFGLAAFVVLSQPWFIDNSAVGRDTALRDGGFAVVVGLVGVWVANASGRHRVALLVSTVAGLGLVASGLLAEHAWPRTAGLEVAVGVLVTGVSLAGLARPGPTLNAGRHRGRRARSAHSSGRRRPA
ncbi:hypothetical protein [Nocardioides aestuarii]|uniref:Uncharacterized protein n=1 Tax=Nocardioides aestuarii TaxID=252231 RepID=A0ABW4TSR1_9ACTN